MHFDVMLHYMREAPNSIADNGPKTLHKFTRGSLVKYLTLKAKQ